MDLFEGDAGGSKLNQLKEAKSIDTQRRDQILRKHNGSDFRINTSVGERQVFLGDNGISSFSPFPDIQHDTGTRSMSLPETPAPSSSEINLQPDEVSERSKSGFNSRDDELNTELDQHRENLHGVVVDEDVNKPSEMSVARSNEIKQDATAKLSLNSESTSTIIDDRKSISPDMTNTFLPLFNFNASSLSTPKPRSHVVIQQVHKNSPIPDGSFQAWAGDYYHSVINNPLIRHLYDVYNGVTNNS